MRTHLLLLIGAPLLFLATSAARADVVHLTTGRPIKGQVIKETATQVVVKTPQGKVTLPRRLVKRIEREEQGKVWLEQARELVRRGKITRAKKYYRKATKSKDARVAKAAKKELAGLEGRKDEEEVPRPRTRRKPRAKQERGARKQEAPSGSVGEAIALARAALLRGEGARALQVLQPFAKSEDRAVIYLRGRGFELTRQAHPARRQYKRLLKGVRVRPTIGVAWLGELARRSFSGKVKTGGPAVGDAWKRVATKRFAVYHTFQRVEPWFSREPESALKDVLKAFKVRESELKLAGRIQVFLFQTKRDYQRQGGTELSAGHATQLRAPDGYLKLIRAYPERRFYKDTYRHEVAHTVLYDLYPGLPGWAHEGAASATESKPARARRRSTYTGRRLQKKNPALKEFLSGKTPRGGDRLAVWGYYAYASVVYDTLAHLLGSPRKALQACVDIGRQGPSKGLRKAGLTLKRLELALKTPPPL